MESFQSSPLYNAIILARKLVKINNTVLHLLTEFNESVNSSRHHGYDTIVNDGVVTAKDIITHN